MICYFLGHAWVMWSRALWICQRCLAEYPVGPHEPWRKPSRWEVGL